MQSYFDKWADKVRNTIPLTVNVWAIDSSLVYTASHGVSPFEVMLAAKERLAEILRLHGRESVFIVHHDCAPEFYTVSHNQSEYIWPCRWEIVASDAQEALKRFSEFNAFINEIREILKWVPIVQQVANINIGKISGRAVTFTPEDLVTNHPQHQLWTNDHSQELDSTSELRTAKASLAVQRLELRTSTVQEAKRSLDSLGMLLPPVMEDTYNWKWVIITAHNALQNFIVAALEGTSPGRVLVSRENPFSGSGGSTWEKPKLLSFPDLYDRVKKPEFMSQNIDSKPYRPKGSEGPSISWLTDLRNELTHFDPKTLILSIQDTLMLPRVISDVLDAIEFLAFDSHNVRWHVYPIERVETRLQIAHIRGLLKDLVNHYWTENNRLGVGMTINQIRSKSLQCK